MHLARNKKPASGEHGSQPSEKGAGKRVPAKRRTQAERSEEMRSRLAKSAFEVIADRGHSAFRTAAVAAHAGVSQGAQVHHFATKDGLTLAALDYGFADASARSAGRLAAVSSKDDPIPSLIQDFRDFFMSRNFWVALDITIDGSKNPNIAPAIRSTVAAYRAPLYARWVDVLIKAGWSPADSEEIVRTTSALLAGIGMRSLWEDVGVYLDATIKRIETIIRTNWPKPESDTVAPKSKAKAR